MSLHPLSDKLWIHDGPSVPFLGLPYSTRMTVIRLSSGELWIHSPAQLTQALKDAIDRRGDVRYLVAPNKLHHLFMADWIKAYPQAQSFAAPGLQEKRADILFNKTLTDEAEAAWRHDIQQTLFRGSKLMEEVVFYHAASKTLILTDLIENFNPEVFSTWQRWLAKLTGILAPNGKTPLDWRLSFIFGKPQARKALQQMYDWQVENIVLAHGECVLGGGDEFLRKSFAWI